MIEALLMGGAMGIEIKSIQTIFDDALVAGGTKTIPIQEIDVTKSFFVCLDANRPNNSDTADGAAVTALNPTSVEVYSQASSTSISMTIVEFGKGVDYVDRIFRQLTGQQYFFGAIPDISKVIPSVFINGDTYGASTPEGAMGIEYFVDSNGLYVNNATSGARPYFMPQLIRLS